MQNIGYYLEAGKFLFDIQQAGEAAGRAGYYLTPHESLFEVFSAALTERVTYPILNGAYQLIRYASSSGTSFVSTKAGNAVSQGFASPISVETFQAAMKKIQDLTGPTARRTASKFPVFHYVDGCLIGGARHVFSFAKDIDEILSLPERLRALSEEKAPTTVPGPSALKKPYECLAKAILTIWDWIIHFICTPFSLSEESRKGLAARLTDWTISSARNLIKAKGQEIKERAIALATKQCTCRVLTSVTKWALVGCSTYFLFKFARKTWNPLESKELQYLASASSLLAGAITYGFLARAIAPRLSYLYKAHLEPFDGQRSTYEQLAAVVRGESLLATARFVRNSI